jgi:hypothetical protein
MQIALQTSLYELLALGSSQSILQVFTAPPVITHTKLCPTVEHV